MKKQNKTKQIMKVLYLKQPGRKKEKVLVLLYVALKKAQKIKHKRFFFLAFYPFFL